MKKLLDIFYKEQQKKTNNYISITKIKFYNIILSARINSNAIRKSEFIYIWLNVKQINNYIYFIILFVFQILTNFQIYLVLLFNIK